MNLGKGLRIARIAKGLTQKSLAEQSGLSVSMISMIEAGQRDTMVGNIRLLAEGLNMPESVLVLACIIDDIQLEDFVMQTLHDYINQEVKNDRKV